MTTFQRYTLYQIPGWIIAFTVAAALYRWFGVPLWVAAALFLGYVIKDFVLYPFLSRAYEAGRTGVELLVGETGTAAQRLEPRGFIRVRGELWKAEVAPGSPPVAEGDCVRVEAVRGMTLIVAPARE